MKKDIVRKWVAALRSGQYERGESRLGWTSKFPGFGGDGPERRLYCCLGVLCELAVLEGVIEAPTVGATGELRYGRDKQTGMPPVEVAEWIGVNNQDSSAWTVMAKQGEVHVDVCGDPECACASGEEIRRELSMLNDGAHWTFEQIADALEKNFVAVADAGAPA